MKITKILDRNANLTRRREGKKKGKKKRKKEEGERRRKEGQTGIPASWLSQSLRTIYFLSLPLRMWSRIPINVFVFFLKITLLFLLLLYILMFFSLGIHIIVDWEAFSEYDVSSRLLTPQEVVGPGVLVLGWLPKWF